MRVRVRVRLGYASRTLAGMPIAGMPSGEGVITSGAGALASSSSTASEGSPEG